MAHTRQKRNRIAVGVIILVALAVGGGLAWAFSQQLAVARQMRAEEMRLERAVAAEQAHHDELVARLEYAGSDEYVDVSDSSSAALVDFAPQDAARLLPADIPARSLQQFWLTARIPADAAAGDYSGVVELSTAEGESVTLPLSVRVLPFELADPAGRSLSNDTAHRWQATHQGESWA